MKRILLLWALQIVSVTSLKIKPFQVREFTKPILGGVQTRIYGGVEAKEGEYPFMIFILCNTDGEKWSRCSASLLTPDWVLTAAHCVGFPGLRPENVILVGGKANLDNYAVERINTNWNASIDEGTFHVQERRAKAYYIHPDYVTSSEIISHDVALIKARKPFTAEYTKPIPLALDKIMEKKTCTILGWGLTPLGDNYRLNVVQEKEISTTSIGCEFENSIPLICLRADGLSGICRGDSGSPLVCEGKVWGVASYMLTQSEDCGESLEEYYTELSAEKDWIRSVLNGGIRSLQISLAQVFLCAFASLWMSRKVFS